MDTFKAAVICNRINRWLTDTSVVIVSMPVAIVTCNESPEISKSWYCIYELKGYKYKHSLEYFLFCGLIRVFYSLCILAIHTHYTRDSLNFDKNNDVNDF